MKWYTMLAVVALVGLPLAASSSADSQKPDADLLKGKWHLVSGEFDGKPMPPVMIEGLGTTISVERDDWTEVNKGKADQALHYKVLLNPSKTPKQIDLTENLSDSGANPQKLLGIYSLEGDTLKLCISRAGADRPGEFKSPNRNTMLRVFSRTKS